MKKIPLIIACLIFILVSCRRDMDCPEDDSYRYPFVEGDTNVLFYAIHDTITFVNQNFDEITFVCVDKTYWPNVTVEHDGSGDCPHLTSFVSDRIEFVFKPYGNSHKFLYTITADKNFPTSPENKMFFDEDIIFAANSRWSGAKNSDSILFNGNYLGGFPSQRYNNVLLNLDYGLIKFKDINENLWILKEKK